MKCSLKHIQSSSCLSFKKKKRKRAITTTTTKQPTNNNNHKFKLSWNLLYKRFNFKLSLTWIPSNESFFTHTPNAFRQKRQTFDKCKCADFEYCAITWTFWVKQMEIWWQVQGFAINIISWLTWLLQCDANNTIPTIARRHIFLYFGCIAVHIPLQIVLLLLVQYEDTGTLLLARFAFNATHDCCFV